MSISVYIYLFLAAVSVVVLLPLLLIKRLRVGVGVVLYISSTIMGLILWFWSAAYTAFYFGTVWLIVGIMTGVGVVPLAAVGLFMHDEMSFWIFLACFIVPFVSFALGAWAASVD